ncbi:MAG: PqqD family protein [Ruminococcus sp.]|nr:PqqD family protein [Ruminococcus sp.]
MKLNSDYVLRAFSGKYIAVSVNDSDDNNNVFITMNKSSAFVWELLQNEMSYEEVLSKIIEKYNIDEVTAKADLDEFIDKLKEAGVLYEQSA